MGVLVVSTGANEGHCGPPGHVERPERVQAALKGVEPMVDDGSATLRHAEAVTADTLLSVHTEAHVERVRTACETSTPLDWDTPVVPASWDASLLAVGAAVEAATSAANGTPSFAIGRPPGHHATPERAMGFCHFNNIAVAAHTLTEKGERVAIVDVDVHHGNGTQDIFYERDDVLFVSLHQSPLYPGTGSVDETGVGKGEGFTVNLPVPPGTDHDAWTKVFEEGAMPPLTAFAPDVVLVSAGFDGHARDPLGALRLSEHTYGHVIALLARQQPRIAAVLEGGYDERAVQACAGAVLRALAGPDEGGQAQ